MLHTDAKEVLMLNCGPEACVMVVFLWQGCWTEGLHFPPSLPPSRSFSPLPLSLSLCFSATHTTTTASPPLITVADGCRWIPHNHVRTAPPIPIHLFKHISSDGELHKDKGGRQTTKAHKDCPCKQVFLLPYNHLCSSYCSSPPVQSTLPRLPSRAPFLYLCFSFLLIVSIPCQCLSLLSINLPNKRLLSSPPRCLLSTTGASSPHRLLLSDCCLYFFFFFSGGVLVCHKANCDSLFPPNLPPSRPPLPWPRAAHPRDAVNCGSGEVCLTSFQGHALLGPFSPLKGHIISQPPTSH